MTSRLRNLPKWLQANISCVPASDIAVDPSALAVKWGRWKRAFGLYLVARGQTPEVQKRALLLHCAGMSVQDIFETPPNKEVNYDDAARALGGYFRPKLNHKCERHLFHQLQQKEGETMDRFLSLIHI